MFERRLKSLLIILLVASAALALRAAQIQLLQHDTWQKKALDTMKRDEMIETTRGRILDRKDRVLAEDAPCMDVCVDYRAIEEDTDIRDDRTGDDPAGDNRSADDRAGADRGQDPSDQWLTEHARQSLRARLADQLKSYSKTQLQQMLEDEKDRVRGDLAAMWQELAIVGNKTPEEIDQIRRDIVQRVEMRKRYIWWRNYEHAAAQNEKENAGKWYREFLADSTPDDASVDKFEVEVGEETTPHMILHNVSPAVQARLARQSDRFFALSLVPSKYRAYPFNRAACNLLGYLDTARPEEVLADADMSDIQVQSVWTDQARQLWPPDNLDRYGVTTFRELRKYWPADLVGRAGIEGLCENTLRGTRGKIERVEDSENAEHVVDTINAIPGRNVRTTIDIQLEQDIENDFVKTRVHRDKDTGQVETRFNQHGAAVVLDIKTNEVLAMVSNPGFDLNSLTDHFADYSSDELNRPMANRATEDAVEPGSTVKPIVGSGSITDGIMKPTDTIQCRGVLFIDGKPQQHGHCWIYDLCSSKGYPVSHGPSGAGDPNIGPDDMLTITDGIRESCNVVFETIALRMKMPLLSTWYDRFGLGRRTGLGIEENPGLLYHPTGIADAASITATYQAGIGEGFVHATPIQMANVAATLARNGLWMRPRLVPADEEGRLGAASPGVGPDQVDLHLSPQALQAVQTGMRQVCTRYATGHGILPEDVDRGPGDPPVQDDPMQNIQVAGKTGSAQTGGFMSIIIHDPVTGKATGHRIIHFGDPGTDGWYLSPEPGADPSTHPERHLAHAWFMGYAPADHPQVAFCVLVEYGEAGGRVAGSIAHDVLVDCVKHGYLSAGK